MSNDQVIQTSEEQQYLGELLGFVYTIEYRLGKHKVVVGALLRRDPDDSFVKPESTDEPHTWFLTVITPVNRIMDQIRCEKETDPELLHQQLKQLHFQTSITFVIVDFLLQRKIELSSSTTLRIDLVKEFHGTPGIIRLLKGYL